MKKKTPRKLLKQEKRSLPRYQPDSTQAANSALARQTIARPDLASPAGAIALQRMVGNRAAQSVLDPQPRAGAIQRFSDASLTTDNPIDWLGETISVTKSEEGVSGGVYFFQSGEGELVVKPEKPGADPIKAQFADKFLREGMNISAPVSRVVMPDSNEGRAITRSILTKLVLSENAFGMMKALRTALGNISYYKVMPKMGGKSISSLAKKSNSQEKVEALITQLSEPGILQQIGRLLVADAFINNGDRIRINGRGQFNFGNIMLSGNIIQAIDSDSELRKFDEVVEGQKLPEHLFVRSVAFNFVLITDLFTRREQFVPKMFGAIAEGYLGDITEFDAKTYFETHYPLEVAAEHISAGIVQGIADLKQMLTTQKQTKQGLKTTAKQGSEEAETDWDTFKTNAHYFLDLEKGLDPEEAKARAVEYGRYRRWKPDYHQKFETITTITPELLEVPDKPPELTGQEKTKRALTIVSKEKNKIKELSKELKQKSRRGEVDPELEAKVLKAKELGGRRAQKALYLAQFTKFTLDLTHRADMMGQLHLKVRRFKTLANQDKLMAQLALQHIQKHLEAGGMDLLMNIYMQVTTAKGKWAQTLKPESTEMGALMQQYDAFDNAMNQFQDKVLGS